MNTRPLLIQRNARKRVYSKEATFYVETNNTQFPTFSQTTKQAIFVGRFSRCPDRYKYNTYCRLFITDRKMFLAKPKIGQAILESLTLTDFYRIADFSLSLLLKNRHTFHCWCRLYYSNFSRKLFQKVHKINKYSLLSSVFHNIRDSRFREPRAKRIS